MQKYFVKFLHGYPLKPSNIFKYFSFRTKVFLFFQNHPFQAFLVSKQLYIYLCKKTCIKSNDFFLHFFSLINNHRLQYSKGNNFNILSESSQENKYSQVPSLIFSKKLENFIEHLLSEDDHSHWAPPYWNITKETFSLVRTELEILLKIVN